MNAFINLFFVFDTSDHIKILDYRVMKEAVKAFLQENFNLAQNRVRIGVAKYGDTVEIPIALGDYDSEADLLERIGDTRRLKGESKLGKALKETAGEFLISGADEAPRVVIIMKSGDSA